MERMSYHRISEKRIVSSPSPNTDLISLVYDEKVGKMNGSWERRKRTLGDKRHSRNRHILDIHAFSDTGTPF